MDRCLILGRVLMINYACSVNINPHVGSEKIRMTTLAGLRGYIRHANNMCLLHFRSCDTYKHLHSRETGDNASLKWGWRSTCFDFMTKHEVRKLNNFHFSLSPTHRRRTQRAFKWLAKKLLKRVKLLSLFTRLILIFPTRDIREIRWWKEKIFTRKLGRKEGETTRREIFRFSFILSEKLQASNDLG